ncbi:hypothetical protein BR93DRAFT_236485 [Coniochaeta sp. PMI_546]|nr:hypothetical protein BR93DRAFT_236485 [Coniochaeta sp. PMI_546]
MAFFRDLSPPNVSASGLSECSRYPPTHLPGLKTPSISSVVNSRSKAAKIPARFWSECSVTRRLVERGSLGLPVPPSSSLVYFSSDISCLPYTPDKQAHKNAGLVAYCARRLSLPSFVCRELLLCQLKGLPGGCLVSQDSRFIHGRWTSTSTYWPDASWNHDNITHSPSPELQWLANV